MRKIAIWRPKRGTEPPAQSTSNSEAPSHSHRAGHVAFTSRSASAHADIHPLGTTPAGNKGARCSCDACSRVEHCGAATRTWLTRGSASSAATTAARPVACATRSGVKPLRGVALMSIACPRVGGGGHPGWAGGIWQMLETRFREPISF